MAKVAAQEILKSDPDVLALQECPTNKEAWANELFKGYTVMGVGSSHAGYIMLLVRDSLAAHATSVTPGFGLRMVWRLPAVMAQITDPNDSSRAINVASCHLAPFQHGANDRSSQIQEMLDMSEGMPLVITGDTNMRDEEDTVMEGAYDLRDAWKEAGGNPKTQFSWDTSNHLEEGGFFNRYYGERTREYTRRYDRLYISKGKGLKISVESFGLVANEPVNPFTRTHFLSDHFGISVELNLE